MTVDDCLTWKNHIDYITLKLTDLLVLSGELETDHYFLLGRLPFLGLAENFFPKNNSFQTIFFITFCNENNFLRPF